jgi:hypothetical protein
MLQAAASCGNTLPNGCWNALCNAHNGFPALLQRCSFGILSSGCPSPSMAKIQVSAKQRHANARSTINMKAPCRVWHKVILACMRVNILATWSNSSYIPPALVTCVG